MYTKLAVAAGFAIYERNNELALIELTTGLEIRIASRKTFDGITIKLTDTIEVTKLTKE